MASIYSASIDLSQIDKSKIVEKNGKKWYPINVIVKDEVDQYGYNIAITENRSKEEREAKKENKYLGNGKLVWSDTEKETKPQPQTKDEKEYFNHKDDLPF